MVITFSQPAISQFSAFNSKQTHAGEQEFQFFHWNLYLSSTVCINGIRISDEKVQLMSLYQLEYNKNESAIFDTKKDWFTIYILLEMKREKKVDKPIDSIECIGDEKWKGILNYI